MARLLVRLDHSARCIENTNHGIMRTAVKACVANCIVGRTRLSLPQATEWQHIGNQIKAAPILARSYFVNMRRMHTHGLKLIAIKLFPPQTLSVTPTREMYQRNPLLLTGFSPN